MVNIKKLSGSLLLALLFIAVSCKSRPETVGTNTGENKNDTVYKVTFIELGSVNCIPCRQMQPVMKSIEQKYSNQVKVIFYDVWTEAGKPYAEKYGVKSIPAQIFLGSNGKEYFRHEGFFPEEDVVTVLKMKGVN